MTTNQIRIDKYRKLTWAEQYAYKEGLLDSYTLILDSIQEQMTNNDLAANKEMYDACDKLARYLRTYLTKICSIETNC